MKVWWESGEGQGKVKWRSNEGQVRVRWKLKSRKFSDKSLTMVDSELFFFCLWPSHQYCHWAICVRGQACLWQLCGVQEPFSRLSPFPWRPQYRMGALPSWSWTSPLSLRSATWPTCPSSHSSFAQQVSNSVTRSLTVLKYTFRSLHVYLLWCLSLGEEINEEKGVSDCFPKRHFSWAKIVFGLNKWLSFFLVTKIH